MDPLRVYMYNEGMVRLATESYNANGDFENPYIHLTNYAINKNNKNFTEKLENNEDGYKRSMEQVFEVNIISKS